MSELAKLEAAILADRDDVEVYLVYADWLQTQGDPRGELVVMQNQIQATDDKRQRRALQKKCDEWIARHDLLGPLRAFNSTIHGRHADVTWRYGFIRCLEIGWGHEAGDSEGQARAALEAVLRHPSSTFITVLTLGPAPGNEMMDMQCLLDAITSTKRLQALRSLYVGRTTAWPFEQTATGDVGAACAVLPRLQKLTINGGRVTIGALALPELVELRVTAGRLSKPNVADLRNADCPALEHLELRFGERATATATDLSTLLGARRFPALRHLTVTGCSWPEDLVEVLAKSELVRQLTTLGLPNNGLDDRCATTLVRHAAAFRHLDLLDVGDNAMNEHCEALLANVARVIEFGEQDPPFDDEDDEYDGD